MGTSAKEFQETMKKMDALLQEKNIIIGQGRMLKKVLELTAPVQGQLPPAYVAALHRINFLEVIDA